MNPVDRKKCTPMEDAVRHGQDVIYSLLKRSGGVRSNHPTVLEYLERNLTKRKAQRDMSLKNRTMRVVESTMEFGLIKKLETSELVYGMAPIQIRGMPKEPMWHKRCLCQLNQLCFFVLKYVHPWRCMPLTFKRRA